MRQWWVPFENKHDIQINVTGYFLREKGFVYEKQSVKENIYFSLANDFKARYLYNFGVIMLC